MGALYQETARKNEKLRKAGYKMIEMWEHDFDVLFKTDVEFKNMASQCNVKKILCPRDAFYGGRTNAIKLYYDCETGERIWYVDFTSLYPWVNKYCEYGVGQPKVLRLSGKTFNHRQLFRSHSV